MEIAWKIAHLPFVLTFFRTKRQFLFVLKHVFAEQMILFPTVYFLLKPQNFLFFGLEYAFLVVLCWTFYEIDYLVNDFIAVKYEDLPFYRDYTKHVNFAAALAVRIVFLTFSAFLLQFNFYFLFWMLILGAYIAMLNMLRVKKSRITVYPCMRTLRALFVPLVMSNFNSSVIYICLVLYLPVLLAGSRTNVIGIVERYLKLPPGKIELYTTYYEIILKLLPLQIFLLSSCITLFNMLPLLSGELSLALLSFMGRKTK